MPPSMVEPLAPERGLLEPPWRPLEPLSEVKITTVSFESLSRSRQSMIWPVDQSISSTESP